MAGAWLGLRVGRQDDTRTLSSEAHHELPIKIQVPLSEDGSCVD